MIGHLDRHHQHHHDDYRHNGYQQLLQERHDRVLHHLRLVCYAEHPDLVRQGGLEAVQLPIDLLAHIGYIMVSPDFECDVVCISDSLLADVLQAQMSLWTKAFYPNPVLVFGNARHHVAITDEMRKILYESEAPFKKEVVVCLLRAGFLLLCGELASRAEAVVSRISHSQSVFQRFMESISRRKVKKASVASYASELCVSPKYLTSVCMKESGRSAAAWISQFVMDDISHYLKNTDLSAKEISDLLGFPNQSFFGKFFKKETGRSPGEWRREARGD